MNIWGEILLSILFIAIAVALFAGFIWLCLTIGAWFGLSPVVVLLILIFLNMGRPQSTRR